MGHLPIYSHTGNVDLGAFSIRHQVARNERRRLPQTTIEHIGCCEAFGAILFYIWPGSEEIISCVAMCRRSATNKSIFLKKTFLR